MDILLSALGYTVLAMLTPLLGYFGKKILVKFKLYENKIGKFFANLLIYIIAFGVPIGIIIYNCIAYNDASKLFVISTCISVSIIPLNFVLLILLPKYDKINKEIIEVIKEIIDLRGKKF